MSIPTSILADLLSAIPEIRTQLYFKSSLTALSHAMEDRVLAGADTPLTIASFQRERFYRQEAHRYRRIAEKTEQVYVLAAPEAEFKNCSDEYETIAFDPDDGLAQEWHLIVISQTYCCGLICREKIIEDKKEAKNTCRESSANKSFQPLAAMDTFRRFEGIWTFDRPIVTWAAKLLLERIIVYRPELRDKVREAFKLYQIESQEKLLDRPPAQHPDFSNNEAFAQRLVTYLQAGQYKLLKAYRAIADREQKERLVNSITTAIRRSLDPEEILQAAVEQLGTAVGASRCLIYQCQATDRETQILHEFYDKSLNRRRDRIPSLQGQVWVFGDNPLFTKVAETLEPVSVSKAPTDELFSNSPVVQSLIEKYKIISWLMVPVIYKDQLLGIIEIHHCRESQPQWQDSELKLVEAIAAQIAVALLQAQAYSNLESLNQQLEALDRTRSNLVAITGHELRTPLSTIQVCLESLASEPDMLPELRQVMLNTALQDGERMRKLIQDFLILSRLEGGQVEWNPETLSLAECIELAISGVRARNIETTLPEIMVDLSTNLLVRADGEWLVEVLAKLIDNSCKFTAPPGKIAIAAANSASMVEVTISDTGRGIVAQSLETIFDLFYQEEGALRRTAGGTGLGLAICRQIVTNWGGKIWAESAGRDRGSQFHFTVPLAIANPQTV